MGNVVRRTAQFCGCAQKPRPENRTVHVGNNPPYEVETYIPEKYPNNRIVSSKYTAWNFLPKNLFEQFQRIANFYFLCVGFIELVIDSPVSPVTSIFPLVFVLTVTAIKQGYEDWLRHKADKEVNNSPAYVLRDGRMIQIKAQEIKVGDIVRVQMNHGFPCDMVMLSSQDPEGECYITTANLDGETNLKSCFCVPDTRTLQTVEAFQDFRATIQCKQPIADFHKFEGIIKVYDHNGTTPTTSLCQENVLLRGARLRNTPYVFGCAVYTGQETKMALNSKFKKTKFSRVERAMNTFLVIFLCLLVGESAVMTGLKHWFYSKPEIPHMWYVQQEPAVSFKVVLEEFLGFMVLMNYIIPISMYVTVELQKFFGSMFFQWDRQMYDPISNERAKANTSDLNEELGQVEYLFTDKTGTLTENDMQFRQCSVDGTKYEEFGGHLCIRPDIPDVQPTPVLRLTPEIEELLTVLVLCHTVRVDRKDNNGLGTYSETGFEYEYQASSPDEKAFVEACRRYGVIYHGIRDDKVEVTVKNRMHRYTQHHVLEFDATRKRMSVIVEDEMGQKFLLCKGAEIAILERVVEGDADTVERHVVDYAKLGLRTLVITHKKLTDDEFTKFDTILTEARKALDNREKRLSDAYDLVERNLVLLGATAVEDKLQEGVPETIEALRIAGIKVWVLTGDKEETAVNISYSAGHFSEGMREHRITQQESSVECGQTIKQIAELLEDAHRMEQGENQALIVDGRSLPFCLHECREDFRHLCKRCSTVLCCRMSPLQKAEVVHLMKTSKADPTTAAIGDGANDVSMIQEAHVGLGIFGKEGRQAVRCSDYAFGRFCFLKRALLVHGHYFYIRIATLVQYFFYKNVAFITAQLYFAFFSAFSIQSLFDSFFLMFYNITFTSLPILLYGLNEQHIPQKQLSDHPELYRKVRRNAQLTIGQFLKWNLLGLWHSIVFFFGAYAVFYTGQSAGSGGQMLSVYEHGFVIYTTCVITVNIKLMLNSYHWTGVTFFGFILTFVGYVAMCSVYSGVIWLSPLISNTEFYYSMFNLLGSGVVWLTILLLVVTALVPDIVLKVYEDSERIQFRPHRPKPKIKPCYKGASNVSCAGRLAEPLIEGMPLKSSNNNYNGVGSHDPGNTFC